VICVEHPPAVPPDVVRSFAIGATAIALLAGCREPLKVPYLPAKLENWPTPYRGVPGLRVDVVNTGTLDIPSALLFTRGSIFTSRTLDVPAFVIRHPRHGIVIFDAGLSGAIAKSAGYVGGLIGFFVRPWVPEGGTLSERVSQMGIAPKDVRHVVLSTLRFEHAGDVEAFTAARVTVSRREREAAAGGAAGYMAGEVDDVEEWKLIDFPDHAPLGTFPRHVDLFGDGSISLIDVAGHTPGGMALLIRAVPHPIFLAGDLVPVGETLRYAAPVRGTADRERWWEALWRLKKLKQLVPDLVVLPGHDLAPARAAASKQLAVHELEQERPVPTPTPEALRWRRVPLP
jgi:glyoxylase-like metal-dependent hydrolase (beta-lactamase superfamily II)